MVRKPGFVWAGMFLASVLLAGCHCCEKKCKNKCCDTKCCPGDGCSGGACPSGGGPSGGNGNYIPGGKPGGAGAPMGAGTGYKQPEPWMNNPARSSDGRQTMQPGSSWNTGQRSMTQGAGRPAGMDVRQPGLMQQQSMPPMQQPPTRGAGPGQPVYDLSSRSDAPDAGMPAPGRGADSRFRDREVYSQPGASDVVPPSGPPVMPAEGGE